MAYQDGKGESPSHDTGMRRGEKRADPVEQRRTRTSRDATSINPQDSAPIDPRMPQLPPA